MAESILIVEDEPDIARLVALNLEAEGFECQVSGRGDEALDLAFRTRPDLVVLDVMLPGVDGVEVCRQLRKDPRTAAAGIIMLTALTQPEDRVAGFEAGADDYLGKPFHLEELVARIQTSLRRARRLRATSPLTGLPGNFEIETRLDAMLAEHHDFALLHVDIDGFKAYNDRHGFVRGDRAILLTAQAVTRAVDALEGDAFVGHIGGDDFVVLCPPDRAESTAAAIVEAFDDGVGALYDDHDRAAGYIESVDRSGTVHRHPLITVSVGIASSSVRSFGSSAEAAAVASELKSLAKGIQGSAWRIDRRRS